MSFSLKGEYYAQFFQKALRCRSCFCCLRRNISARDEVLRFVKQYIETGSIEGNLKLWIAGRSRGAAVSNLLAGFFAGGGIEYF